MARSIRDIKTPKINIKASFTVLAASILRLIYKKRNLAESISNTRRLYDNRLMSIDNQLSSIATNQLSIEQEILSVSDRITYFENNPSERPPDCNLSDKQRELISEQREILSTINRLEESKQSIESEKNETLNFSEQLVTTYDKIINFYIDLYNRLLNLITRIVDYMIKIISSAEFLVIVLAGSPFSIPASQNVRFVIDSVKVVFEPLRDDLDSVIQGFDIVKKYISDTVSNIIPN